jgi:SpoIID/LytB domain protein
MWVMSRCRYLAGLIVAIAIMAASTVVAGAQPDFSFVGSGWGHGAGLSQYGAKALGADGANYQQIINRYFTGTNLAPFTAVAQGSFIVNDETPLWVGLRQHDENLTFEVQDGTAYLCFDRTGGCLTAQPGETWRFTRDGSGSCMFLRVPEEGGIAVISEAGACDGSVRPVSDRTILHIPVKARSYRYGILRFREAPTTEKLQITYEIGVEHYMRGLSEVPESWSMASIEAQVVTSRSFVVWHALDRGPEELFDTQRKDDCYCNLRDDTSDLVFRGWTGEATHPRWAAAVESTTQEVITSGNAVALGLYSSSSGGFTETYAEVFGGDEHHYLATVDDQAAYSDSAANPHASWGAGYSQAALGDLFGFDWVADAEVTERNPSGSAKTVRLAGIVEGRPAEITVTGVEMRSALSLRSTTFDLIAIPRFDDVSSDHTFAGEILGLHELGVTTGCTPARYCPDRGVTRGEMAAFLVRALGLTLVPVADTFGDDNGHFFEGDIETLYARGVTTGCTPTRYCPDRGVTRAEMAAFLVRGFDLAPATGDSFVDDDGSFFEDDIEALRASGVTSGCNSRSFCPNRAITRAEMAAFLIRALASG